MYTKYFPVLGECAVKMEDTSSARWFICILFLQLLYNLLYKYLVSVARKGEPYIFCMKTVRGWFEVLIWYLAAYSIAELTSVALISKMSRMNVSWIAMHYMPYLYDRKRDVAIFRRAMPHVSLRNPGFLGSQKVQLLEFWPPFWNIAYCMWI